MIYSVIPVKKNSDRVSNKNFRPIHNGKSLLDIKLQHLQKSKLIKKTFISSDFLQLKKLEKKNSKLKFVYRKKKYCNNIISWSDMIYNVVKSLPCSNNSILVWSHTTSPFFSRFDEAINKFKKSEKKGYDSLFASTRFNGFLLDSSLNPVNYQWGLWHKYSQYLSKYHTINGALFIARKQTMLDAKYVIGKFPINFDCNNKESIDIDNEEDFEYASYLLNKI